MLEKDQPEALLLSTDDLDPLSKLGENGLWRRLQISRNDKGPNNSMVGLEDSGEIFSIISNHRLQYKHSSSGRFPIAVRPGPFSCCPVAPESFAHVNVVYIILNCRLLYELVYRKLAFWKLGITMLINRHTNGLTMRQNTSSLSSIGADEIRYDHRLAWRGTGMLK